jgi:hypothetical protein
MASLIISVFALLISAFTFFLQFIAHDSLLYNISHVSTTVWPTTNAYFTVSLSIFNTGNRAEALLSAVAVRIQRSLGDQSAITDLDCVLPKNRQFPVYSLFPVLPGQTNPELESVTQYDAVVDAGKIFSKNLIFGLFSSSPHTLSTDDYNAEGVVCLKLLFTDSTGKIYPTTRALGAIQFKTAKIIDAESLQQPAPTLVIYRRRIELPF